VWITQGWIFFDEAYRRLIHYWSVAIVEALFVYAIITPTQAVSEIIPRNFKLAFPDSHICSQANIVIFSAGCPPHESVAKFCSVPFIEHVEVLCLSEQVAGQSIRSQKFGGFLSDHIGRQGDFSVRGNCYGGFGQALKLYFAMVEIKNSWTGSLRQSAHTPSPVVIASVDSYSQLGSRCISGCIGLGCLLYGLFNLFFPILREHDLTSAYCRSEDVWVHSIVVPELKLSDVQRHVSRADFMERADHAALEDRPEAFNRVGVDRTDHVLLLADGAPFPRQ
jgi:hypothetical protein